MAAKEVDLRDRIHQAKTPRTRMAGTYGHPFHPLLVTIPIGAWVASLVFDLAGIIAANGSTTAVQAGYWLIAIGVVGAVVAAVFGLIDLLRIPTGTLARRTAYIHMSLNLLVVVAFAVNFWWRSSTSDTTTQVTSGQLALSIGALVVLSVSGWLGGQMVYRFGVRVVEQEDQTSAYTVPRPTVAQKTPQSSRRH